MLTCTSVLCLAPGRRARPFPAEAGEPHWTYSSTQMILVRPSLVFSQSVKHSHPQKVLYPSVMPPLNHSLPPTSRGRRIKGKAQWVKVRRVYLKTTQRGNSNEREWGTTPCLPWHRATLLFKTSSPQLALHYKYIYIY